MAVVRFSSGLAHPPRFRLELGISDCPAGGGIFIFLPRKMPETEGGFADNGEAPVKAEYAVCASALVAKVC